MHDINVGQKVHFNFDNAISMTNFLSPSLHIKGEAPGP